MPGKSWAGKAYDEASARVSEQGYFSFCNLSSMTLLTIVFLLILGLALIVLEILIVPGTTLVGIAGLVISVSAVWAGFLVLSPLYAWSLFGISLAITGFTVYKGFQSRTWELFSVKQSIDGKSPSMVESIQIGEEGELVTRCSPIGQARFGQKVHEVYSEGDFLPVGSKIKISSILNKRIFVTLTET
jgi:membrane-bound ClpP family serine protease